MRYHREEVDCYGRPFVVLSFETERGEIINDDAVRAAAEAERLHIVDDSALMDYRRHVLNNGLPGCDVVAFGNTALGPSDSGSFPGVLYLDAVGEIQVAQNWARGHTGDQWKKGTKFLFLAT